MMDGMESDYAAIPELDRYDEDLLDHRNYDQMDAKARSEAEVYLLTREII